MLLKYFLKKFNSLKKFKRSSSAATNLAKKKKCQIINTKIKIKIQALSHSANRILSKILPNPMT